MPGFLSAYEGTEHIDLGNGYWADVKKFLSSKEYAPVEAALGGKQRMDVGSGQKYVELDSRKGRTELVVASLVAWNLDDADGTIWPLSPDKPPYSPGCERRQSVDRLPDVVFNRIWQVCDTANDPESADPARFPGPAELGDPDGDTGAGGPAAVPDRAGDVAEVRADPGSPGGPAAA